MATGAERDIKPSNDDEVELDPIAGLRVVVVARRAVDDPARLRRLLGLLADVLDTAAAPGEAREP
jgi:hypothetical protein